MARENELIKAPSTTSKYRTAMKEAMEMLARDERVLFLGQTVGYSGSRYTYGTLEGISREKRIELPIMEEAQMGMATGLALAGYIPVSIYPRCDFLLLAANQLVNHLDKMAEMSEGEFRPKVIIRAVIGGRDPVYPGPQHCQDHSSAFETMLSSVDLVRLTDHREIMPAYERALNSDGSTLLIDYGDLHFKP